MGQVIAIEKALEALIWAVSVITAALGGAVVIEKAVDAAKESEDEFDQEDTKACANCGTSADKADSTVFSNESTEGQGEENEPPKNKKARTAKPGEKVRTPDSHPEDFKRGEKGKKVNVHTGDVWDKSHTTHNDPAGEWKVGTKKGKAPRKTDKVTIGKDGTVIKIDK
jgi:hypothetical protein